MERMAALWNFAQTQVRCDANQSCETGLPHVQADNGSMQTLLQLTFGIIGALAVIFLTVAAIRYVAARGNPQEAAKARGGIIYAAVGLVIAICAEAFVTFVLGAI